MPDEEQPKIIADTDWKAEAQREKERLAAEAEKEKAAREEAAGGESLFLELVDMLAQQAVIALGGAQTSDGRVIPPSPPLAKHFIDMLDMVQQKTKGNLTKEEGETLNALLSRLRWAFSMGMTPPPGAPAAPPPTGGAKPKP
jgi:hypothetical protein